MKDLRIIVEQDKKQFEEKVRNNLNEDYKMISTNLSTSTPIQTATNIISGKEAELVFYAYMEKEV